LCAISPTIVLADDTVDVLSYRDVERAMEACAAGPTGLQTVKTREDYTALVAQVLGLVPQPRHPSDRITSRTWHALRALPDADRWDIAVDTETDVEGALRGLLAYPMLPAGEADHPLEHAVWITPSWARRWRRPPPRAEWFPSITDGHCLTPNELARLTSALDNGVRRAVGVLGSAAARFAVMIGSIVWTGLLPKRLLRARLWTGDLERLRDVLTQTPVGDDLVILLPRHGLLLCRADEKLVHSSDGVASVPPLIPVPLPAVVQGWARAGWDHDDQSG
jgi:hypothetical protein